MGNTPPRSESSDSNLVSTASVPEQTTASVHTDQPSSHTSDILSSSTISPLQPHSTTSHRSVPITRSNHPHGTRLTVSNVPPCLRPIRNLLLAINEPGDKVKRELLSEVAGNKAVALVGMSGVGKTTILHALGHDKQIWAKFPDGVWFFDLSRNIDLPTFISLLQQFFSSISRVIPENLNIEEGRPKALPIYKSRISELMNHLSTKKILLLFDDWCDENTDVYALVRHMYHTVLAEETTSCKILVSTTNGNIARPGKRIEIVPKKCETDINRDILCCHAGIKTSDLQSLSDEDRNALECILKKCCGLPLALSIAGIEVSKTIDPKKPLGSQDVFVQCWNTLKTNRTLLLSEHPATGHKGLRTTLKSNLESMKSTRMKFLFCLLGILQKQPCFPIDVIQKLWGEAEQVAQKSLKTFEQHNLITNLRDGQRILGIEMNDLMHDLAVDIAESQDGVKTWHAGFVDKYRTLICLEARAADSSQCEPDRLNERSQWWNLSNNHKYMINHIVHHLLEAGCVQEVVELLVDYRWVEKTNEDDEQHPFQKYIAELQMLRNYLEKSDKKTAKGLASDIDVIMKTIDPCTVLYCIENRRERAFQFYDRLCSVEACCALVKPLLWSIKQYGQLPLALAQTSREEKPKIPTVSEDGTKNTGDERVYDVFISHAGPDKSTIAIPLYNLLKKLGLKVFLDKKELKCGDNAPERMINAMKNARIAVVILSPEFAAKKWPMKELMCFLERHRKGSRHEVTIIPVFYRLSLEDCKDEKKLFALKNKDGENVFTAEEFLVRMSKEMEHTIRDVRAALNDVAHITGIEHVQKETCDNSTEEFEREKLIQKIVDAVREGAVQRTGK